MGENNKLTKVGKNNEQVISETLIALLTTPSYTKAAELLGITFEGLAKRRLKYQLDKRIAEIPKQALERLQLGSVKAAETFVKNLDDEKKDMEAAAQILDRVGLVSKTPAIAQQFNVGGEMTLEFVGKPDE